MQVNYPAHQIRADLDRQRMQWRFIETTARIVCRGEASHFLATLVGTRVAFDALCNELALGLERARLANQRRDLLARAQAAIDILVRNLFERTADVGFIATDAALVAYLAAPATQDAQALRARLHLYRSFYSVYNDIALIDPHGRLVWRLDETVGCVDRVVPPKWLAGCLRADGYVEVYEAHAWWAGEAALVYAHRVRDAGGEVLGVVALRFALTEELNALRAEVLGDQPDAVLAFVDGRGQVLQSSDAGQLPSGCRPRTHGHPAASVRIRDSDWAMAQAASSGYQGYAGPGWQAWVVSATPQTRDELDADLPSLQEAQQALQSILTRAQETAADLRLVLFNGKVTETGVPCESRTAGAFADASRFFDFDFDLGFGASRLTRTTDDERQGPVLRDPQGQTPWEDGKDQQVDQWREAWPWLAPGPGLAASGGNETERYPQSAA
jgi:hypothetical protein